MFGIGDWESQAGALSKPDPTPTGKNQKMYTDRQKRNTYARVQTQLTCCYTCTYTAYMAMCMHTIHIFSQDMKLQVGYTSYTFARAFPASLISSLGLVLPRGILAKAFWKKNIFNLHFHILHLHILDLHILDLRISPSLSLSPRSLSFFDHSLFGVNCSPGSLTDMLMIFCGLCVCVCAVLVVVRVRWCLRVLVFLWVLFLSQIKAFCCALEVQMHVVFCAKRRWLGTCTTHIHMKTYVGLPAEFTDFCTVCHFFSERTRAFGSVTVLFHSDIG